MRGSYCDDLLPNLFDILLLYSPPLKSTIFLRPYYRGNSTEDMHVYVGPHLK